MAICPLAQLSPHPPFPTHPIWEMTVISRQKNQMQKAVMSCSHKQSHSSSLHGQLQNKSEISNWKNLIFYFFKTAVIIHMHMRVCARAHTHTHTHMHTHTHIHTPQNTHTHTTNHTHTHTHTHTHWHTNHTQTGRVQKDIFDFMCASEEGVIGSVTLTVGGSHDHDQVGALQPVHCVGPVTFTMWTQHCTSVPRYRQSLLNTYWPGQWQPGKHIALECFTYMARSTQVHHTLYPQWQDY